MSELSEMITDFIAELRLSGNYPLADALEDAFRTQKEAFRAGWVAAIGQSELSVWEKPYCDAAFEEWERGE